MRYLRLLLGSALLELLDAASLVEGALLTRVERMRLRGDFNHDLRVLLTVNSDGLRGLYGRANEKGLT